ncbi:MAG: hypothetical protein AAF614_12220 [Chloroflexota bacterium]
MKFLTQDAILLCDHGGVVSTTTSQDWVTINGRLIQVAPDPKSRPIAACPNVGVTIKPCTSTLRVQEGYSDFIFIDGQPICLEAVKGLTDGTPPMAVNYTVKTIGQDFVGEAE